MPRPARRPAARRIGSRLHPDELGQILDLPDERLTRSRRAHRWRLRLQTGATSRDLEALIRAHRGELLDAWVHVHGSSRGFQSRIRAVLGAERPEFLPSLDDPEVRDAS